VSLRHLVLALVLAGASSVCGAQNVTYDLIIRGGRIVDGTGAPSYRADLAVSNGRIAMIGRPDTARARRVIDATGWSWPPGSST
jgi:N-acyl-D-aspartate/D-glutamate deacylase